MLDFWVNSVFIDDNEEIETLRHDLFNKLKEKITHGCIGRTANYWYLCDYFGDSTYKIRAQIQISGNESFLNDIERKLTNRTYRDPESFVRRVTSLASGKGQHYYGDVDVKIIRGETVENALLDSRKTENKEDSFSITSDGQGSRDNAGTGLTISSADDWNKDFQLLTTSQVEIHGECFHIKRKDHTFS